MLLLIERALGTGVARMLCMKKKWCMREVVGSNPTVSSLFYHMKLEKERVFIRTHEVHPRSKANQKNKFSAT